MLTPDQLDHVRRVSAHRDSRTAAVALAVSYGMALDAGSQAWANVLGVARSTAHRAVRKARDLDLVPSHGVGHRPTGWDTTVPPRGTNRPTGWDGTGVATCAPDSSQADLGRKEEEEERAVRATVTADEVDEGPALIDGRVEVAFVVAPPGAVLQQLRAAGMVTRRVSNPFAADRRGERAYRLVWSATDSPRVRAAVLAVCPWAVLDAPPSRPEPLDATREARCIAWHMMRQELYRLRADEVVEAVTRAESVGLSGLTIEVAADAGDVLVTHADAIRSAAEVAGVRDVWPTIAPSGAGVH